MQVSSDFKIGEELAQTGQEQEVNKKSLMPYLVQIAFCISSFVYERHVSWKMGLSSFVNVLFAAACERRKQKAYASNRYF